MFAPPSRAPLSESVLEQLHTLLSTLSPCGQPSSRQQQDRIGEGTALFVSCPWFDTRIKHSDIAALAESLFSELLEQFERLLSIAAAAMASASPLDPSSSFSEEGFLLLLRCCMSTLQLLEFDLGLLVEKCEILLSILRKLCRPNMPSRPWSCKVAPNRRIASNESAELWENRDFVSQGSNAKRFSLTFFTLILEVFIDELLMHQQLRKHFTMTDNASATTDKLFVSHGSNGEVHVIQEIMFSHFLLSTQCNWMCNNLIKALFWGDEVVNDVSKISLDAAMVLLCICSISSVPHMLRAHMILSVSKYISIHVVENNLKSTEELLSTYISAFEVSVNLYVGYLFSIDCLANTFGCKDKLYYRAKELSSNSCIQPIISNQLQHHIDCLIDFCRSNLHGMLSGNKADIMTHSTTDIKDNGKFFEGMCKDQAVSILESIISNIVSEEREKNTIHEEYSEISEEMFCVIAVLRLMSSSLLQILRILRQKGYQGGNRNLDDHPYVKEYDFVLSIINRFAVFDSIQLVNNMLDLGGQHVLKRKEPMLMMIHFASLLSFSFRSRFGVLWKSCILMIGTVLNLYHFEEGRLDMFISLLDKTRTVTFHDDTLENSQKVLVHRKSSAVIAFNLQHIQKLYLSDRALCLTYESEWAHNAEDPPMYPPDGRCKISSSPILSNNIGRNYPCASEARTCNGESFIRCLSGFHENPSECNDLVDFIECKLGKDYSSWLKQRNRFKKWQQEKIYAKKRLQKERKVAREPRSRNARR